MDKIFLNGVEIYLFNFGSLSPIGQFYLAEDETVV